MRKSFFLSSKAMFSLLCATEKPLKHDESLDSDAFCVYSGTVFEAF